MLTFKSNYFGESEDWNMSKAAQVVRGYFPTFATVGEIKVVDLLCKYDFTVEDAAEICRAFLLELTGNESELLSADDFQNFLDLEFTYENEDCGPDWASRCESRYGYNCY